MLSTTLGTTLVFDNIISSTSLYISILKQTHEKKQKSHTTVYVFVGAVLLKCPRTGILPKYSQLTKGRSGHPTKRLHVYKGLLVKRPRELEHCFDHCTLCLTFP